MTAQSKAHAAVSAALRSGRLRRAVACESCGTDAYLVAHHDDYSAPLIVRWLCLKCHAAWHKTHDAAGAEKQLVLFLRVDAALHSALTQYLMERRAEFPQFTLSAAVRELLRSHLTETP